MRSKIIAGHIDGSSFNKLYSYSIKQYIAYLKAKINKKRTLHAKMPLGKT